MERGPDAATAEAPPACKVTKYDFHARTTIRLHGYVESNLHLGDCPNSRDWETVVVKLAN